MKRAKQPIGLRSHLDYQIQQHNASQEVAKLIYFLGNLGKNISHQVRESEGKLAGTKNQSGDHQLELDVIADKLFIDQIRADPTIQIHQLVSEEQNNLVVLNNHESLLNVSYDPYDGSKEHNNNNPGGMFVGIWNKPFLQGHKARNSLIASMLVHFGLKTKLYYTMGNGVFEFEQDGPGDFVTTNGYDSPIKLKDDIKFMMPGGKRHFWTEGQREFVRYMEKEEFQIRYHGAFAADLNHIICKRGGIFAYSAHRNKTHGPLRMLYEMQPMALMFEQMGGRASNGIQNVLDVPVTKLDQRGYILIGSKKLVDIGEKYWNNPEYKQTLIREYEKIKV